MYAHTVPATDTARLLRDLFPAEVELDGEVIARQARVFVTDSEVIVFVEGVARSVREVHRFALIPGSFAASRVTNWTGSVPIETSEGKLYAHRERGCGCHSPLKAMTPPAGW
jgi:hypothetical protein